MFHVGGNSQELPVEDGVGRLSEGELLWIRRQKEHKNLEPSAEKQLPHESPKHQVPEILGRRVKMNQGWHKSQGRLGRDEGGVHLRGPGAVLRIFTLNINQRLEDQCSSTNELPVEVHHSQKLLQSGAASGWIHACGEEQIRSWRWSDQAILKQQRHTSPG